MNYYEFEVTIKADNEQDAEDIIRRISKVNPEVVDFEWKK